MTACSNCGAQNPERARFCLECGVALPERAPAGEVRKVVTILFMDVAGSTALGERLDPEAVRGVMGRYFSTAREAIEQHGGTVEKFIGDAVMAVFGIPQLHEDDAIRAIRAADAIRHGLATLNDELQNNHGLKLLTRTGINTGEVISGDPAGQTLVTGDAVNTAARLEQAAEPGSIVIGELTYRLVHEAVDASPLDPVDAKGKAEPVRAYRVDRVSAVGDARDHGAGDLVGREDELRVVMDAYARASATRTVTLVTVLGQAGVGKSRLLREVAARLPAGASVIRGRCLPYGDGTAQWPIREALRPAAGIEDGDPTELVVEKLEALAAPDPSAHAIAEGVAQLMSVAGLHVSQEDAFWATRRMLERMAETRPLVAIFEDLHWADTAFLDLLEYIVDLAADAPVLIVATARPDLLESRATWASGRANTQLVRIEPLNTTDVQSLCRAQEGGEALPVDVVTRIADASEGNPLFVEEMVAMLRDDGLLRRSGDAWELTSSTAVGVPPTIRALIASRLDRLPDGARRVAAHGSVIGRIFETATLAQIASDDMRASLTAQLLTLVRREFIRPARGDLGSGDAFAFRHVLIRDAAYEALPKRERADLHVRLADWIERTTRSDLTQFEEVVAHHLEAAYRYRVSLGGEDDAARELARRASAHLRAIGERALAAGAISQAVAVLRRALPLAGNDPPAQLLLHAGDAIARSGDPEGVALLREAERKARAGGTSSLAGVAMATRGMMEFGHGVSISETLATIGSAVDELLPLAEPVPLARAYGALAYALWGAGRMDESWHASLTSVEYARAGGDDARVRRNLAVMSGALVDGPAPVGEGIAWCLRTLEEVGESRNARYPLLEALGWLYSAEGRHDAARRSFIDAKAVADELGQVLDSAYITLGLAEATAEAGDLDEAEAIASTLPEHLDRVGSNQAPGAYALLARIRTARGSAAAALELIDARPIEPEWDVYTQGDWLRARALALLALERLEEAAAAAERAIELLTPTELTVARAHAHETMGLIHLARNRPELAAPQLQAALDMNVAKESPAGIVRTRELLDRVRRALNAAPVSLPEPTQPGGE